MNDCKLPLISIVMPVYNSEKTISRAIQSVLNQTYNNIELLIINDGSTDKSEIIINGYLYDNRIKYVFQKNSGPSKARNKGIETALGKYIIFVDSDDYIKSDYIEKLFNGITLNDSDICCCGYECLERNSTYLQHDFMPYGLIEKEKFVKMILLGTGGTVCSKIYKLSTIIKNKIKFDEKYNMCEDQLFAISVWEKSLKFCSIDYYGYIYDKSNSNSLVHCVNIDKWYAQYNLVEEIYGILLKVIGEKKSKEFINFKLKSITRSLLISSVDVDWKRIKTILKNDNMVLQMIQLIDCNSISDYIFFYPVKVKWYTLVYVIYNLYKHFKLSGLKKKLQSDFNTAFIIT